MARAGLTAERIVRAGLDLADESGFESVSLSSLARHFDVKVASLYSHVRDVNDLKTRLTLRALEELADLTSEALAGRSGKKALASFAHVYRDYAREHPGRSEAAQQRLDSATALASAGVRQADLLRALLRGYDLPERELPHAVRLLGSVFAGYSTLELGGSFDHSAPDTDESWARIVDALDALLRHWPSPPQARDD